MIHNCIKCGVLLVVGRNVTQYKIDHSNYICRACGRERQREYARKHPEHHRNYMREWLHRTGKNKPMNENRYCSAFLGVHIAERVLAHVFKHVERMPTNNPGFDIICNGGYKIDIKSACRLICTNHADRWIFQIRKNQIAEYFLLIAFDNREDLNPEHIWLIPSENINDQVTASMSETTLSKWDDYKLDINRVSACCDAIKGRVISDEDGEVCVDHAFV